MTAGMAVWGGIGLVVRGVLRRVRQLTPLSARQLVTIPLGLGRYVSWKRFGKRQTVSCLTSFY
ncbi:hypothetical protein BDV38DRAFT_259128 [Aspergillus pseudotamarii]|uniref:Uncharacterized protein n=1 Tax=Aspergillus pseudotamarii TaxID=132259 RepID=A0A5N6SEW4_ASPPS|nr:uncharacterized protein BDV38DRAFT_259128 [Aspergillus pseudotamarii]KAE8133202.1 hypothetical protein BDV38DRAFT_259128 [Aspergillus pseudotamarii]